MEKRNYGIDLLRLVLMFMVCVLHALGQGGVLSAFPVGSAGYRFFYLPETICYCAVDAFALISGYTAKEGKKQKYARITEMWFQVFFYSFVLTGLFAVIGLYDGFLVEEMIKCALPVRYDKFWYFTAYFGLFFMMPILNRGLFLLEEKSARKFLIGMVLLFSVFSVIVDPFKLSNGYSMIWLVILYCLGVLMKKVKLFENIKSVILFVFFFLNTLIVWLLKTEFGKSNYLSYLSPFVLLNGMLLLVSFSRLKPNEKLIKTLSPLAFGIYLFQLNQVIWKNYIRGSMAFVVKESFVFGFLYVLLFAVAIFLAGLAVEFIRSKLFQLLRISKLCDKIASLFERGLELLSVCVEKLFCRS